MQGATTPAAGAAPAGQEVGLDTTSVAGETPTPPGANGLSGIAASAAPATAFALGSGPRSAVRAFENLNTAFAALTEQESRETWVVSADGQHWACKVKTGLSARALSIDGKVGPRFPRIMQLSPRDDFSQVVFTLQDKAGENGIAVQQANGSAKAFQEKFWTHLTAQGHDPSDYWDVLMDKSLRCHRLVRRHTFEMPHARTCLEFQVDAVGPVPGPFNAFADGDYDAKGH